MLPRGIAAGHMRSIREIRHVHFGDVALKNRASRNSFDRG